MEVETKTVERKCVTFDSGESFPVSKVLDFLEMVEGTDGFIRGLRCTGMDDEIAEHFKEMGVVGHTHAAGYYEKDAERRREMFEELLKYYD